MNEARLRDEIANFRFELGFTSSAPLWKKLALSEREAEALLWVAQGKSNADVGAILAMSEKTVKKHLGNVFQKLGVESRTAATLRALEALGMHQAGRAGSAAIRPV